MRVILYRMGEAMYRIGDDVKALSTAFDGESGLESKLVLAREGLLSGLRTIRILTCIDFFSMLVA